MLHFWPLEPDGHVESFPYVHCTEHTGWPSMSNESVHTPLAHSVDMLLTTVQVAPNGAFVIGAASGPGGGDLPAQAASAMMQAKSERIAGPFVQAMGRGLLCSDPRDVSTAEPFDLRGHRVRLGGSGPRGWGRGPGPLGR